MNKGDPIEVLHEGIWKKGTFEFRVEHGEPLGEWSIMLDGGGRVVVCACRTRLPEAPPLRAYFFGCWNQAGHFLFDSQGRRVWNTPLGDDSQYDTTYAPRFDGNRHVTFKAVTRDEHERYRIDSRTSEAPQGHFLRHYLKDIGFTLISWWDRSQGDKRGACNSNLFLEGDHTSEIMLGALRERFPHVLANLEQAGIKLIEVRLS